MKKENWSGAVFNKGKPEYSWPTLKWYPIETLPDGYEVLLFQKDRGMLVGYIERGISISGDPWMDVIASTALQGYDPTDGEEKCVVNPTHWSPLPLPPHHRVYVTSEQIRRELTDQELRQAETING